MPLVTRNANTSSYYKGTTSQESTITLTQGDAYYNTSTDILKTYNGSALRQVGSTSFSSSAVVTHDTTIGDYTTPSSASYNGISETGGTTGSQASITTNVYAQKLTGLTVGRTYSIIAINVTTAAGNVRIKAYQDDGTAGAPSTLLAESGSIAVGGTGWQEFTLTSSFVVPASGNVYIGFECDNVGLSIKKDATTTQHYAAHAYGAGPSPFVSGGTQSLGFNMRLQDITNTVANIYDTNTATEFSSASAINAAVYVDMGSSLNIASVALYWDSATTETEIKLQVSADASTWTDMRKITESNLTNGAWTYWRNNIKIGRYVRIYGNSGIAGTLKIYECKVYTRTDAQILGDLGILQISNSDTTLGQDGT